MAEDRILYHYCSSEAFASIVQSRSIWLSSLALSNDSLEGRMINASLMRLAERDGLDYETKQRLQSCAGRFDEFLMGLGFCMSENGDLLSQWRGYADDAKGLSIGFSLNYLKALQAENNKNEAGDYSIHKVDYDPDSHDLIVEPTYLEIRQLIDEGAFRLRGAWGLLDIRDEKKIAEDNEKTRLLFNQLMSRLMKLFPRCYRLKSRGFEEEREWRLVSTFIAATDDKCVFRGSGSRVIPYRVLSLPDLNMPSIKSVILGPKHQTSEEVMRLILAQSGFAGATVSNSEASYR